LIQELPADQLDPSRTHAVRLSALPIGYDLWSEFYLRPNGEVVVVGADLDQPDVDTIVTEPRRVLMTLVWGSERYPALRQLLPERGPGTRDCESCRTLAAMFPPNKRPICSECGGLGWLPVKLD
jgi:hypothetical protein